MNRLKNKTVLITGASSGIGRASSEAFASHGAHLIVVARREAELTQLKNDLSSRFNVEVFSYALDVQNKQQIKDFFDKIPPQLQQIDILLNNAGLALELSPVMENNPDDWDTMLDTNVKGLFLMSKAVLATMYQKQSGHIINLGSVAGIHHYANGAAYCATKAAVHAFSNALREECIEKNIKISEVMPGMVNTEFSTVRFKGDNQRANNVYTGMMPLTAEDVADLIIYTANLPAHVNLAQSLIYPIAQAGIKVHRS